MTYKTVHGLALLNMSDLIKPYIPTQAFRSQNSGLLLVPRIKKKSAGWRAFSYQAPFLWNNLLADIRQSGSVDYFKSKLKTHFFD